MLPTENIAKFREDRRAHHDPSQTKRLIESRPRL
jgi:hypothetical protein